MTIRHQLDTLSITDAPAFPLIDDAIITCELSEFSPTSEDELSGLVKKIAAKSRFLDPVPASLLRKVIEKVAAMRLTNYLCDNDLNESLQFAYKKHHSCETALLINRL